MPISYNIDNRKRRIFSHASGHITAADLRDHMYAEVGAEAVSYSEIFDCSNATTDLTGEDIRKLAAQRQQIAETRPSGAVAVVAPTDLFFGLFRMFDMLTDEVRPIRVFRSFPDAEKWLDSISAKEN